jgi:hypothetical protein
MAVASVRKKSKTESYGSWMDNKVRQIRAEISFLSSKKSSLHTELQSFTLALQKECSHKKVVYTDGHVSFGPDDDSIPEVRICLGCGLSETGERNHHAKSWAGEQNWGGYKLLTAKPIRRFCVPGRLPSDTIEAYEDQVNREVKYARENGKTITGTKRDAMLEEHLIKYWFHVSDRLFAMSYPARIRAVMKLGYPA